jgi:alpha-mannosidase
MNRITVRCCEKWFRGYRSKPEVAWLLVDYDWYGAREQSILPLSVHCLHNSYVIPLYEEIYVQGPKLAILVLQVLSSPDRTALCYLASLSHNFPQRDIIWENTKATHQTTTHRQIELSSAI